MKNFLLLVFLIAYVTAQEKTQIIDKHFSVDDLGSYNYGYRLSDDTNRKENGVFVKSGDNGEGILRVHGFYEYISPEGIRQTVYYEADEDGFRLVPPPPPPHSPTRLPPPPPPPLLATTPRTMPPPTPPKSGLTRIRQMINSYETAELNDPKKNFMIKMKDER